MGNMTIKTWDIFCRVIDNYGDIGVCWRLARQLANEYPFKVRLWVDELEALRHIWPDANLDDHQLLAKVEVCRWNEDFDPAIITADVVVEAFACSLPDTYLAAMKLQKLPVRWFNLEYLSAEDWVEGCHGLVSVHPQLGLKKIFFFPGFTDKTGGLLKEKDLIATSGSYFKDKRQSIDFEKKVGIESSPCELVISLFGYPNEAVPSLLQAWVTGAQKVLCLVPAGKLLPDINRYLGESLAPGDSWSRGSLRLQVIPFLTQTEYDQLLWRCDINFVRGEDSFVRAQWAGKPFVWHIYPQDDGVHKLKLDAFLARFLAGAPENLGRPLTSFWQEWNSGTDCAPAWNQCVLQLESWQTYCKDWRNSLNSLADLVSNMVQFCQKTL